MTAPRTTTLAVLLMAAGMTLTGCSSSPAAAPETTSTPAQTVEPTPVVATIAGAEAFIAAQADPTKGVIIDGTL